MAKQKLYIVVGICCLLSMQFRLGADERAVQRGIEEFEAGDLIAARQTFEAALEDDARRTPALAYLGRIALAQDELDLAIDRLKQAVELDQDDSMYRTWLGRAYIAKLQTVSFFEKGVLAGRAMDALKKAVELDPTNVEARVSLAGYYLNAPALAGGSKRKAREQADAITAIDPARGASVLAGIHIEDEEYDLAREKLAECIASLPEAMDCRFQLAMMLQELGEYEDAFEAFERILELEPESHGALYQLARTAVFSGTHVERGIVCLERYLGLEVPSGYPGHDAAHWRLGMLFEHLDETERARSEFEAAIELNPNEKMYRESLDALGAG